MTYVSYTRGDDGTWVFTLSVSITSKFDSWKVNMTSMSCYFGDIDGTPELNSKSVDGTSEFHWRGDNDTSDFFSGGSDDTAGFDSLGYGGTSEFCSRCDGGTCEFSSSSGVSMAS
jgi:hypothetical protein